MAGDPAKIKPAVVHEAEPLWFLGTPVRVLLDGAEAAYRRAVERGHPSAYRDLSFVLAAKGHQRDASRTFMSRPGERI